MLRARMTCGANPFGDGRASSRIVDAVHERLSRSGGVLGPRRLDHHAVNARLERLVGAL
jgi:hypothetical protein